MSQTPNLTQEWYSCVCTHTPVSAHMFVILWSIFRNSLNYSLWMSFFFLLMTILSHLLTINIKRSTLNICLWDSTYAEDCPTTYESWDSPSVMFRLQSHFPHPSLCSTLLSFFSKPSPSLARPFSHTILAQLHCGAFSEVCQASYQHHGLQLTNQPIQ